MRTTKWFRGEYFTPAPENVGLYQTKGWAGFHLYRWWDGKRWGGPAVAPERAYGLRNESTGTPPYEFRGLAERPGA